MAACSLAGKTGPKLLQQIPNRPSSGPHAAPTLPNSTLPSLRSPKCCCTLTLSRTFRVGKPLCQGPGQAEWWRGKGSLSNLSIAPPRHKAQFSPKLCICNPHGSREQGTVGRLKSVENQCQHAFVVVAASASWCRSSRHVSCQSLDPTWSFTLHAASWAEPCPARTLKHPPPV